MSATVLGPTALWYLTRGTGIVALLLLTGVILLGVLGPARIDTGIRWPRFAIGTLHRDLSLLAIVFIAVHVLTSVLDGFAPITLVDGVVPFGSGYRPLWLGLGALAFDLLLAVVLTSLVRRRLGYGAWRAVHWLAYLSWPVAVLHGLGTGSDAASTWLLVITFVCVVLVALSVVVRAARERALSEDWRTVVVTLAVAVPAALALFAFVGPLAPHWAARAGTPTDLLGGHR